MELQLQTSEQRMQARANLVESFGAKKQKRVLHAKTKFQLSEESLNEVAAKVRAAAKSMTDSKKDSSSSAPATAAHFLPPHNFEAEKPADVYPLSALISSQERAALAHASPELDDVTQEQLSKWRGQNKFMVFIINILDTAVLNKTPSDVQDKVLALKYLVELLKLYEHTVARRPPRDRKLLAKTLKRTPATLVDSLTSKFLTVDEERGGRLSLSKKQRELLVMYIIVMGLHACNYSNLPLEEFASDLKMTVADLRKVAQTLGCSVYNRRVRQAAAANASDAGDEPADEADGEQPAKKARVQTSLVASLKLPLRFVTRRAGGPPRK